MASSHSSDRNTPNYQPPIAGFIFTAILGGTLALAAIRLFPNQFIPQDIDINPRTVTSINKSQQPVRVINATREQSNFVTTAIKKVAPAIVKIESDRTLKIPIPPIFNDPSFERFFGRDNQQRTQEIPYLHSSNQGSGVIIREDGMILTNAHIVNGADHIQVTLSDGRKLVGTLLGIDQELDLAIVNVNADNLSTVSLGKSRDLKLGDWVISIGNPFGRDQMVSLGIVSTLKHSDGDTNRNLEWIQTDAVINRANSGGALLNQKGEVIGINTAVRPDTTGIGFVIPIEKFISVRDRLLSS